MNRREQGKQYEAKAAAFLEARGVRIIARNFRCRQGETDLIGLQEGCLVFVEVKYRSSEISGTPEEAVGALKQQRICRTSDYFRVRNPQLSHLQVRYDVIAVTENKICWYQNAFSYQSRKGVSW